MATPPCPMEVDAVHPEPRQDTNFAPLQDMHAGGDCMHFCVHCLLGSPGPVALLTEGVFSAEQVCSHLACLYALETLMLYKEFPLDHKGKKDRTQSGKACIVGLRCQRC